MLWVLSTLRVVEGKEAAAGAACTCAHQHPCHAQRVELLLPRTEPSSTPDEVEILGREQGMSWKSCGHAREDHAAMEGMEFKSYINPCLALYNF